MRMWLSLFDLLRATGPLPLIGRPVIHVKDEGSHLLLSAHLPGIDRSSLQLQVAERSLALGGSGRREERLEGPNFQRSAASNRTFLQRVDLPARVVPSGAKMAWEDDLLYIRLPKA
jgi:HSP20 family molecular chaperone IbpA